MKAAASFCAAAVASTLSHELSNTDENEQNFTQGLTLGKGGKDSTWIKPGPNHHFLNCRSCHARQMLPIFLVLVQTDLQLTISDSTVKTVTQVTSTSSTRYRKRHGIAKLISFSDRRWKRWRHHVTVVAQ